MKKDLRKLHEQFVSEKKHSSKRSSHTIKGYKDTFDTLMKLEPNLTLSKLNKKTLNRFFEKLNTRKRKIGKDTASPGVKDSTIMTYHCKLSPFFNWLIKNGDLKKSPLKDIQKPSVKYNTKKYMRGKEVMKIITSINFGTKWRDNFIKKRNCLMICLCVGCGLRKSEMRGLYLNDINLNDRLLTVRAESSKVKMDRLVPIPREVVQQLKDYINERDRLGLKCPHLIISGNKDEQLTDNGLKHVLERIKEESGVKFSLHPLRHTFAVNFLLKNKGNIFKLKDVLGHTETRTTDKYLRCLPTEEFRDCVDDITPTKLF